MTQKGEDIEIKEHEEEIEDRSLFIFARRYRSVLDFESGHHAHATLMALFLKCHRPAA